MSSKLLSLLIAAALLSLTGCAGNRMQLDDNEITIGRTPIILDAPRVGWAHEISKKLQLHGFEVHRNYDIRKSQGELGSTGARYVVVVHAYEISTESEYLGRVSRFDVDIVDSSTEKIMESFYEFGDSAVIPELALKISNVLIHLPD